MDEFKKIKKWHQEYFVNQCRVGTIRTNVEWMIKEIEILRGKVERYKGEAEELGSRLDRYE